MVGRCTGMYVTACPFVPNDSKVSHVIHVRFVCGTDDPHVTQSSSTILSSLYQYTQRITFSACALAWNLLVYRNVPTLLVNRTRALYFLAEALAQQASATLIVNQCGCFGEKKTSTAGDGRR